MDQQATPAKFPTGGEYVDALQYPALAFADEQLRRGTVRLDPLGLPEPISGNFASVFSVTDQDGNRWAVKCFVRPEADRQRRYNAIAKALKGFDHPALVDFEYQPAGVMVAGVRYPLLKMRWIEAQGLMPWLEANRTSPDRLTAVANQFVAVVNALEKAGIAHGDLQHGNLLITPADDVKLIDYDGMYVPRLKGLPPNEKGLANYQHPRRSDRDFGPGLDRFSAWVIYVSLVTLAARPELWGVLRSRDDDTKILFAASDYRNSTASRAFAELRTGGVGQISALAEKLAAFTTLDLSRIPPLTVVDHLPPTTASVEPPSEVSATERAKRFAGGHLRIARAAGLVAFLSLAAAIASVMGLPLLTAIPVIVWTPTTVISAVIIFGAYRRHPMLAARQRADTVYLNAQGQAKESVAALTVLQQRLAQLDTDHANQLRPITDRCQAAVRQRDEAIARAQTDLQRSLSDTQQLRNQLSRIQKEREDQRLEKAVDEHIKSKLRAAVIAKDPPTNIDAQVVHNLAASGFVTAADFVGYHTSNGPGRYPRTFLRQTSTTYGTHVNEVGDKRAKSLLRWRERKMRAAERTAPTSLTDSQRQEVAREIEDLKVQLSQRGELALKTAQEAIREAQASEAKTQLSLRLEQVRLADNMRDRRQAFERLITGGRAALTIALENVEKSQGDVQSFATITASGFLRATVGL